MPVNTATNLDALFIQYHEQVVAQQMPQATPFLSQLQEGGSEFQTNQKGWKANAYLRQDASNKWGGPGMDFPGGTTFVDKNFYVYRSKYAKSHEIDGSTYNDIKSNRQSLLSEMDLQRRLMLSAGVEQERNALGDGTGRLAKIASGSSTTVLNLQSVADGTHASGFGHDFLIEGGTYDILTSAGAFADASHQNVSFGAGSISRSANTVTVATLGAAPASGSFICWAGSYNQSPSGLARLIDGGRTGNFQNLDASVEPFLNSAKTDGGGQDLSAAYIQNLMLKHTYMNGGEAGMKLKLFASPTLAAAYQQGFWNQVRFTGSDKLYEFGTDKASYAGMPFEALVTIDPDRFYIVDMSDIRKLTGKKLGVHSEDGLTWRQKSGGAGVGSDNWYINYGWEGNYAILTPRKHAVGVNFSTTGFATGATRFSTS